MSGIIAYGVVLWWHQHPESLLPNWVVVLNRTIVVQAIIAVLAGLLLAHAIKFLATTEIVPWSALMMRGFPLALMFFIGFFSHELRALFNQVGSFQTPYLSVEFVRQDREKEVTFGDAAKEKAFETNFQAGAVFLKEAVNKTGADLLNFARFCGVWPSVSCNPGFLTNATAKKEPDQGAASLTKAWALNITYAVRVQNIAECLEKYSDKFENGVPIQEELSEIAANYAARTSAPTEQFEASFNNIINHLKNFAVENESGNSPNPCKQLPMFSDIEDNRRAILTSRSILPYRSMLEAAVLTASGYPVEGARHLEREYKLFSRQFAGLEGEGSIRDSSRSTDLLEFVLRTRMLSMLEQMFEVAGKPDDQIRTLRELTRVIGGWLSQLTGVSVVSPRAWFMACRDGKLRFQDATGASVDHPFLAFATLAKDLQPAENLGHAQDSGLEEALEKTAKKLLELGEDLKHTRDPELAEALQERPKQLVETLEQLMNEADFGLKFGNPRAVPAEFERFLGIHSRALMYTYIRLFEELFWRGSQPIKVADLDTARDYAELALNERELLWGCFSKSGPSDDRWIEITRFYILRAYGLLQAAHATRVPVADPRAALAIDEPTRLESLCSARSTLIVAWRLGLDVKEAEGDSSPLDKDLRPLQHVLTRLNEQPLACRT